ncbi:MAG: hypothetical protein D3924_03255 [Candidatus Electrothrix sp. AR4]|nr:hypothetical protein [Candidatus Electrothrix sp. AR4]
MNFFFAFFSRRSWQADPASFPSPPLLFLHGVGNTLISLKIVPIIYCTPSTFSFPTAVPAYTKIS